jgi:hypothetical protein
MKKTVAVVVLLVLSCVIMYSQDSAQVKSNALQDKKWALQFQLSNDFTLSSFQEGKVSLQRCFSPNSSVRVGVGAKVYNNSSDDVIGRQSEDIVMSIQYLYRPSVDEDVIVYYGAGPSIGYSRQISHDTYTNSSSTVVYYINDYFVWQAGLDAAIGVEWFATHSISFSGEYYGTLSYSWQTNDTNPSSSSPQTIRTKQSRFSTSSSLVRLGVSLYFNF